ncbi:MAG: type II toxin-antitoxin system RelE/ParE family toxin [Rivularia sp. (in: cyanobacteria)]
MYQVALTKSATKELNKLPTDIKNRIDAKILTLASNPRLSGVKKLKGIENTYRVRVGEYRVVYEIYDDVLLVTVIKVGHRSDIYEQR